jgi:hypothetical protein
MTYMKTTCLLVCSLILLSQISAFSQAAPGTTPGYVEGPIREVTYNPDGTATMLVQNVTVHVPADLPIDSPTTVLTVRQLCIRNRLPGRVEPGFLGGTALINGIVDVQTRRFTATDVTVEPAENVIIGIITSTSPLHIQNTEITQSTDPRIITQVVNAFGFPARLDGITVGQPASAEGYYVGGKLYAYVIELPAEAPLANNVSQLNIQRADSRERVPNNNRGDEVDARGFYYSQDGLTPLIRIFRDDNGVLTSLGFATLVPDGVNPKFGVWTFRADTPPSPHPVLGVAPSKIRAVLTGVSGVTSTAEMATTLR